MSHTHVCSCEHTKVVEGVFGQMCSEYPQKRCSRKSEEEWSGSELALGEGDRSFDEPAQLIVKSYTMTNSNRMEVVIITWGATIVSLKCPDKFGRPADVVLGFDNLKSYMDPTLNPFIGCILGRCANRIKEGCFTLKDKLYQLSTNDSNLHHIHGGTNGFGRQVWNSYVDGCNVVMTYLSQDGEEGYPGAMLVTIIFQLTADNRLNINMRATTSKTTIVNMTHGTFFNLAGHGAGEKELGKHQISLNCNRWTFADYEDPIPTGAIRGVGGTIMDLRIARLLAYVMYKVPPGEGYDHNFCVVRSWEPGISFVARALHAPSGRVLEVYSDKPGVQFYTSGRFPPQPVPESSSSYNSCLNIGKWEQDMELDKFGSSPDFQGEEEEGEQDFRTETPPSKPLEFIPGKNGARYKKHCAFSIQPQSYPNAVNIKHFPCVILRPGQVYLHELAYKFGIQLRNYM
ncbi:aldose 1-epimerase [Orussus abietinus]|uniref:aldose 1-epimerase n=1 Tax=Orussus abietinus TaxID=222816 RepID=UPI000626C25E|nr:aldose 1-epimerase [Orussus abietinus]